MRRDWPGAPATDIAPPPEYTVPDLAALDPHVRRLLGALSLAGTAPRAGRTLEQRRAAFRALMRLSETGPPIASAETLSMPGPGGPLALRVFTPRRQTRKMLPGIVHLHGGGLVCGDLDTHDALCRTLCDASGCRVIAVDYRLAPEHPYPAAVLDAYAAIMWVFEHADALGLDPARIVISGDSAGATLAAVVCQLVPAVGAGALALQLLLCPVLDCAGETASRRAFGQGFLLDRDDMEQELAYYLPAGQSAAHPHVSPLRAANLRGQPPAHIHVAAFDPLREEGTAYAARLRAAGVEVRHTCHPGMVHLFYGFGRVVPYAREALRRIGAEVAAAVGMDADPSAMATARSSEQ